MLQYDKIKNGLICFMCTKVLLLRGRPDIEKGS